MKCTVAKVEDQWCSRNDTNLQIKKAWVQTTVQTPACCTNMEA